jgi:glycosyltransferase involved in cell wall biosynthesis
MLNLEFPPIGGGAANANYYILKEFAQNDDFEIDLVTSAENDAPKTIEFSRNIRIYKLNVNKKSRHYWTMSEIMRWTWKAYRFSKALIKRKHYELCHCWFGWPSGLIGYMFRKNIPYVVALRGSDVPGYNMRLWILDRILFNYTSVLVWRNAKAVVALSDYLRKMAERTYDKKEILVVYNGVDVDEFTPNTSNSEFTILFVGRLIKRKGLIYLLKAFKGLSDQFGRCTLIIVGDGHKVKISPRVIFLGAVNHQDIPSVYQNADVLVIPSIEESLGNVTLEGMASGLPIITTCTGASELIDGNGFVVEKRNSKQIEEAVKLYLTDPGLVKEHGQQGRKIAEGLKWNRTAQAYVQIYNSITEYDFPTADKAQCPNPNVKY